MERFRDAAAGSGVVPWILDLDRMEEGWFLPMAAPAGGGHAISVAGARVLARRLRAAVAVRGAMRPLPVIRLPRPATRQLRYPPPPPRYRRSIRAAR